MLAGAIRAELSKLCSLPATWLTLGGTLVLAVLLASFFASAAAASGPASAASRGARLDSLDLGLAAVPYAQAGLFVFGVVAACSEYSGRQITTTLLAMPQRASQRLAATIALATVALPVATLMVLASIGVTALVLGEHAAFPAPAAVVRSIAGAVVYLVLMVICCAAVGSITRRALATAGVIVLYVMVVGPLLLEQPLAAHLLPDLAGYTLWFTAPDDAPPAIMAWLVVLGWTLAASVASAILFLRRDA